MKRESRPTWFKMFRNQKALIDSVPDAEVGQALKAVYQYFEDGTVAEMTPLVFAVFSSVKPYVDESYADFETASRRNRENIKRRWTKREGTSGIKPLPPDTADTEAEADTPNGVDASEDRRNIKARDAALVGGLPTRFYVDNATGRVIDRGEGWI